MAVEAQVSGEDAPSIFSPRYRQISAGLLVVVTLVAFEAMAVSAALPTAARDLHALGAYGWAFTGFLTASIVAMVVAGLVLDTSGPSIVMSTGLAGFVVGLLLSGTATTMAQFVGGRIVQGLSGGLIVVCVYVVIGEGYPDAMRPPLFAATSSAWVVPSLVGPALSGLVTQHVGWRWVFLGLVPFAVLACVLVLPTLRRLSPARATSDEPAAVGSLRAGRPRLVRAAVLAAGIAALEQAGQHPSVFSIGAAVVIAPAAGWSLRGLLPPGTLRVRPGVSAPVALRGLLAGAFFGVDATVPLLLSVQHGYNPTLAALPLAVAGCSWAAGSWWQGRADDGRGPQVRIRLIRTGFVCVALGAGVMAFAASPATPGWLAYPAWLAGGLGAGLTMSSVSVLMLKFTTDADRGSDSAALQLSDSTANALTTGLAGVLVAAGAAATLSFTTVFVIIDLTMCAIALIGVLTAGRARAAA